MKDRIVTYVVTAAAMIALAIGLFNGYTRYLIPEDIREVEAQPMEQFHDFHNEDDEEIESEAAGEIYDIYTSIGQFYITGYCGCDECCGYWASVRHGKPVTGASGEILKQGFSIAADTDVIPMGTIIYIDGQPYKVQDRGSYIKGNRLDMYFETHEQALQFNSGYYDVFVRVDCD